MRELKSADTTNSHITPKRRVRRTPAPPRLAPVSRIAFCAVGALFLASPWAPAKKVEIPEHGTVLVGTVFHHFDRNGDGIIEEWHRRGLTFFDRNGDGQPDLYRKGEGKQWELGWDENFDGIFDAAFDIVSQPELETTVSFPTISQAPGVLKRERFSKRAQIALAEPRWLPYARIAGLAPGKVPRYDPEATRQPPSPKR